MVMTRTEINNVSLNERLSRPISMSEIERINSLVENDMTLRIALLNLAVGSTDMRTGRNALWCMTHLQRRHDEWLQSVKHVLIDRLIVEPDKSRQRMILQILRNRRLEPDYARGDLFDFCLCRINDVDEPYAVRANCLYVAAKICRLYPELAGELLNYMELLEVQSLSAGLKCALRKVKNEIGIN